MTADNNIETQVKALVGDFKLEEALDVLINDAKTQNERKENTLLILKGKLAMLEEQALAGMLDPAELTRQKTVIAHQILDIADGSTLDHEAPVLPGEQPQVIIQKTVQAPAAGGFSWKIILIVAGLGLVLLMGLLFRGSGKGKQQETNDQATEHTQPSTPEATEKQQQADGPSPGTTEGKIKVLDFPNLKQAFNFLDFKMEFAWVEAEWISDTEIKLNIRYYLSCRNNSGICYRESIKIYADGQAISPSEQSNTAGWIEKDATTTNDASFVLPAHAKAWMIELSRDQSTWKRPFKLLF